MFYPPTCVGLRYGRAHAFLAVFLGTTGSLASPNRFVRGLAHMRGGLPSPAGRTPSPGRPEPGRATPIRRRVGHSGPARCRNVCLLRFGYACRPRLSPRLTLGGLASPRKPRVHGGGVSRSSLATHASILTPARSTAGRPAASPPAGSSPTDRLRSRRFGAVLSPVYCRRASTRPVSCYALFEGVAASKPTSWLSGRTHILCHSARTWGPWRAVWAVSLSSTQLSPHALTPGLLVPGHSEFGPAR